MIATIFILEYNTFVGISAPVVFFNKYVISPRQSSVELDTLSIWQFSVEEFCFDSV